MYDTRSMTGNGASNTYCIPRDVDYGVAVTGIKDPGKICRPVHIVLDSLDEPNVSLGAPARLMKAMITIDSLTPGQGYALLRYNNFGTVPSSGFSPSNANATVYFTASSLNHTVKDSFMSNTGIFYRCIPHAITGFQEAVSHPSMEAQVFPNPSEGDFRVVFPEHTVSIDIVDISGRIMRMLYISGQSDADLSIGEAGIYFLRFTGSYGTFEKKLIVTKR
jgi:hypothetical protein